MAFYDLTELPPAIFNPTGVVAPPLAVAIYYEDRKTPAFRAAATTWLQDVVLESRVRPRTELIGAGSVIDFVMAWRRVQSLCEANGLAISRMGVFGHGSHEGAREAGLEFAPVSGGGPGQDTTFGQFDIISLPQLPWTMDALLMLTNCASGRAVMGLDECIADFFCRTQGVTTIGQRGWSSFSTTWEQHTKMQGHEARLALWSYESGSNTLKGLSTMTMGKRRLPGVVIQPRR